MRQIDIGMFAAAAAAAAAFIFTNFLSSNDLQFKEREETTLSLLNRYLEISTGQARALTNEHELFWLGKL